MDDLVLLREKLDSTTEHLSNIHSFGDNKRYLECEHGPLAVEEERGKAWLTPDSLVSEICVFWQEKTHFLI